MRSDFCYYPNARFNELVYNKLIAMDRINRMIIGPIFVPVIWELFPNKDIWYEGEVEKKVFSKEIKSFWSSEPSYDCIIDGLVNEAYVLSISNPESRLSIMISSRNRGKKNLIIPVTSDKSLLIGENHIPLTEHQSKKPWFVDMGDINLDGFQNAGYTAAPIVPSGQSEVLPQWRRLSNAIKGFLAENYGIEEINAYNDMLNAPALMEAVCHDLKCHGLM